VKITRDELQRSLEDAIVRHRVPGASLAFFHDGHLLTAVAGVANVSTAEPLTPETVMHLCSVTKVINATLVMQLVDEEKVDLDERVVRYLPDLKLRDRGALERITVKMLLNHTSGIDGEWLPDLGHDEETIEKTVGRFAQLGQIHPPGAEFSYCNAGTVIAGYLVQCLRGRSWYQVVRERIFEPLGMEHAATLPEEALLHRASVGHFLKPNSGSRSTPVRSSRAFLSLGFAPAGATLMTSAGALIDFARAHMNGGRGANGVSILSADGARAMREITVDNQGKGYTYTDAMAIGWMVSGKGLFHGGGGAGTIAVLYVYPERNSAAVMLTNAQHGIGLINETLQRWFGEIGSADPPVGFEKLQLPSEPIKLDPRRYVGVYENELMRYRVEQCSAGLRVSSAAKFVCDDGLPLEESVPANLLPMDPVPERFWIDSREEASELFNAHRIFVFKNANGAGILQHLGHNGRLYRRCA
jgi:CubicO group peptidase (beta-lactamase class C family)